MTRSITLRPSALKPLRLDEVMVSFYRTMKKIIYSVTIIFLITLLAAVLIAYGRGYRLNPWEKSINPTGILSAASSPDAASVWIDGKLTAATNSSFSLSPAWYNLRITKEGYQSWEKRIRIQGEVVSRIDALLIPNNPSLRALTVSGVLSSALSPTKTRVAYLVPEDEATTSAAVKSRAGVWIFELKNGPLGGVSDPKQVFKPLDKIDWYNTQILWSPDEKQIILITKSKDAKPEKIISALEIFLDNSNTPSLPVTSTLGSILADWDETKTQKQNQVLESLPAKLSDLFQKSTDHLQFSPDNNKILYTATSSAMLVPVITPPIIGTNSTIEIRNLVPGNYYAYDMKEDKNFFLADQKSLKDGFIPFWYPDSKRIVMVENNIINIIDYDGTNKRTVYSGPFAENIVYPWTSSGQLVILTNLSKPNAIPDLYAIDIR